MDLGTHIYVLEKDCVEFWFVSCALFFILTLFLFFDALMVGNIVDSLSFRIHVDTFSKFVVESLTPSFDN